MSEALLSTYQTDNDRHQLFYDELMRDIAQNRIILPSIPDVVFRIREVSNEPTTDLNKLVSILSSDTTMSARVLQVANNPLYVRSDNTTDDLSVAVSMLGTSVINTLVANLAILQTLNSPLYQLGQHLRMLFERSTKVASYAFALARTFTRISPEQAMLAGLVHDIGYLPILQKAYGSYYVWDNEEFLQSLLTELHCPVGGFVLQIWGFSRELVNTAIKHENIYYSSPAGPDLIDLVIVAELLAAGHDCAHPSDISEVPAFARLGIESAEVLDSNEEFQRLVTAASSLLPL